MKRFARWLFMVAYRSELSGIRDKVYAEVELANASAEDRSLVDRSISSGMVKGMIGALEDLSLLVGQ